MDTAFVIRSAASKFPLATALVDRDGEITFAELDRLVDQVATGLHALGFADAPVASILGNRIDTVGLYLGVARAGILGTTINTRLTSDEQAYILRDSGARTLVVDAESLERGRILLKEVDAVERIVVIGPSPGDDTIAWEELLAAAGDAVQAEYDVDESSPATLIYTSGTTGFPKGVVRTHRANLWNAVNSFVGSPRYPDEVELYVLPLFGVGFVAQVLPTLLAGGTVVFDGAFEPRRTWEALERRRATRVFLAPTMIAGMLDVDRQDRYDVSSLRTLSVAYEFPAKLRDATVERFGDILINMYGLTEAQLCCTAPGEFPRDPSSAGRPQGLAQVRILGEDGVGLPAGTVGEIVFYGPAVMDGYLNLENGPEVFTSGGGVRTGDLGYLDEEGSIHFTGRLKEIIKSGGFSIDPVEIENVIVGIDDVAEAVVVGIPDDYWGEAVVAVVVLARGGKLDGDAILARCRESLAGYKVPKKVVFWDGTPKNPTGKVERGRIREALANG